MTGLLYCFFQWPPLELAFLSVSRPDMSIAEVPGSIGGRTILRGSAGGSVVASGDAEDSRKIFGWVGGRRSGHWVVCSIGWCGGGSGGGDWRPNFALQGRFNVGSGVNVWFYMVCCGTRIGSEVGAPLGLCVFCDLCYVRR